MTTPIERICKFNKQANLVGYKASLEASFLVEEALEGFDLWKLAENVGMEVFPEMTAKDIARFILRGDILQATELDPVDAIDKAADAIVFAVGSMYKLGLQPTDIRTVLNVVMHVNFAKLNNRKLDDRGKLLKPEGLAGPEAAIRVIYEGRASTA